MMIDFGTLDSDGNHRFVYLTARSYAAVDVGTFSPNLSDFPISLVSSRLLGTSSVRDYVISVIQDLQNQIANGSLFLRGAPPEHLVLYDVSQTGAIAQAALIKGIVPPPTDNTPAEAHKAFAAAINQYDAGLRYDLPQRFGNPPTPSYTYVPGGNSCGVTSLRLALNPWAVILFGGPGPPRTTAR